MTESNSSPAPSAPKSERVVRVGILGCGNVGAPLVDLINQRGDAIEAATGLRFEVAAVAVRNPSKQREPAIDETLVTTDAASVVNDPTIDVVVEVIGGIEPARTLILDALKSAKPVVTANKELLANVGVELYEAAAANGVDLLFEAAAAGAIPIMRPLRESLLGEDITRVIGIVNGTTNYMLTRMDSDGASYADALAEAQQRGYAERDPTADVEGYDAGAKAAIMASIAFGTTVVAGDVYHEGIANITQDDITFARHFGYTVKLVAIAEQFPAGSNTNNNNTDNTTSSAGQEGQAGRTPAGPEVGVSVFPAMVPNDHPLASVRGSFNAVFVEGAASGDLMFYGRGAGGYPTASAVLGDLIDAATNNRRGTFHPVPFGARATIRSVDNLESAYYFNIEVVDSPGVLATVAAVFGENDVSIRSMEQQQVDEASQGPEARIAFITHRATERNVQATLSQLRDLEAVSDIHRVLRVIEG